MYDENQLAHAVKDLARQCGFDLVGIAPPTPCAAAPALRQWLGRRWHASMAYMEANLDKRCTPSELVPGARSVICLAVSYAPAAGQPDDAVAVARYARGRDYHKVLKRRCHKLMDRIRAIRPDFAGRAFVDTAPVMERALARRGGLGVIGLNGCLINRELGSYVLLCEIVCTVALASDEAASGDCGRCGLCIEACPTGALGEDGLVDARKCISYLTIEHRGPIEAGLWPLMGDGVFGCDRCQSVCPHNSDVPAGDSQCFPDGELLGGADLADILAWEPAHWDRATRGSAMRRATCEMFLRNAVIAVGNGGRSSRVDLPALSRAVADLAGRFEDSEALCQWALGQLHLRGQR